MENPKRGEIWMVNLDPIQGHEQGGKRPTLIISVDHFAHTDWYLINL
jgi:mRNA interferase MazF